MKIAELLEWPWLFSDCGLQALIWIICILILLLRLFPIFYFLMFSWSRRRLDVINSISNRAAAYYFYSFHSKEQPELSKAISDWEKAQEHAHEQLAEANASGDDDKSR